MKVIKYQICTKAEDAEILSAVTLSWNEVNEELAKNEAYNGAYTIEDDGAEAIPTDADRISELEEALALLLSGVTE
jgi:hypothetical protein